jgi:glycosyltransferase involved in cell wall biosynthesis
MVSVSVIVPVKNDKRLFDLIKALEKQTFKDFEVLIADDSDEKLLNEKDIKNIKLNLKYFHTKPSTISDKMMFLVKKAKADKITITESDYIPSERWLEDLLSEYEDKKLLLLEFKIFCHHTLQYLVLEAY